MRNRMLVAGVVAMLLLGVGGALAVANKSYQVTGPIVSVTDDMIVVQKGKEHWELARDASTKIMGDLKVGEKVTIAYRMVATSVEVKTAMTKSAPAAKTASTKTTTKTMPVAKTTTPAKTEPAPTGTTTK